MEGLLTLLALVSLTSGLITAAVAVRAGRAEGELRRAGERVAGTVVGTKRVEVGGRAKLYPEVQFTTNKGRKVQGVSQTPVAREWPADSAIEVRYDPNAPKQFHAGPSRARMYTVAAAVFLFIAALNGILLLL